MPLLSTDSQGSGAKHPGSTTHGHHPWAGGSWGPSKWAKGRGQKLAAHEGYFGQGSSHLPGREVEELAQEQSPQQQPPAQLCLP